jgi:hypothetical protein
MTPPDLTWPNPTKPKFTASRQTRLSLPNRPGRHDSKTTVAWVATIAFVAQVSMVALVALVATDPIVDRSLGFQGRPGLNGRHGGSPL